MTAERSFAQYRWLLVPAALLLYWVAIFVATHVPTPPSIPISHADKITHFCAFLILASLMFAAMPGRIGLLLRATMLLGLLLLYAAFDEWSQGFVAGRDASVFDWLADAAGAVTGLFGAIVVDRLISRRRIKSR